MQTHGRVWLEINLKTLASNYERISQAVAPCGVIGVLKANAYGLGCAKIAETLSNVGVSWFGVAELNEALSLEFLNKPVQILGGILPEEIPDAVNAGIIMAITDLRTAKLISTEALRQKKTAECHFKIDTGMGRLGIIAAEAEDVVSESLKLPGIDFAGIYSHFPVAYQTGGEYTFNQMTLFLNLLDRLRAKGISFKKIHIANSDAINNFPFTYKPPFNYVRTGINLHGSFDNEGQRAMKLKSVLTLKTKLVAVRRLPAGTNIGYGCTYHLPKDMTVGTISAGYADGLPLALSNRGYVLIRGLPCHILGRLSMDYTTIALDQVPDAECGDEVVCLGGEGVTAITVESWAQLKGTHAYEVICSFGSRVKRCYV